jgi:alpha-glucosidase
MRKLTTIFCLFLTVSSAAWSQVRQADISSPDGRIIFHLLIKNGVLNYNVTKLGKPVIESSSLGLTLLSKQIGNAIGIGPIKKHIINESYAWRGVHSKAINHCVNAQVPVIGTDPFTVDVQVYNDGVAFRYLLTSTGTSIVQKDNTGFVIPAGSTVWSQGDINAYEGKYREQKIEDVKDGELAGPPLTVKLAGANGYIAITEGGVTAFAGMSLKADGKNGYQANLTGNTQISSKIATPWRIIEIGNDLNSLVNCDIIANVSPKPDKMLFPQGFNTPWIQPGKSVWSWLAGNGGVTFDNMKRYSKWAGELGITYNLVDEGWSKWQDGTKDKWALVKELVDYSEQQHVKVWIWKAYPDRAGVPGLKDPEARRAFFNECKKAGVVGLKIDFFDAESQEVQKFYEDALADAAKLHLMLDFHGANKPTGQSRTYPNEMSREGIRGLENGTSWARHNTTLLFTRYLAGHGDYTPLSLRDIVKGTTQTHQVATVAAFTSPFMCLAVNPEALSKTDIKTIVKDIPVVWDETIVLPQSKIGELAILARRSGSKWYLTALNGETAQSIKVNLSFLGKGRYSAFNLEDTEGEPSKTTVHSASYSANDAIIIKMASGGGFLSVLFK